MNQQPLDLYANECFGGYSLKLLNRGYSGPLIQATRFDDRVKVLVYPNSLGKLALSSTIEPVEGNTRASNLGEFLAQSGYTADPDLTTATPTAGVEVIYDQSLSVNHLTNTDINTQPLLCNAGAMYQTEWGYAMQFESGKFFQSNVLEEVFTMHVRAQFPNTTGTKYLLRQDNDLYIKITDLYLDETEGFGGINTEDTLVFLNEFYYGNYTTNDIYLTENTGYLITIEASVDTYPTSELNSPPTWRIQNTGLVHTFMFYSDRDKHVRRHATNQMLSEDIPLLQEKLKRYSPQSYYNYIAGAKAVFGVVSFQGVLLDNDIPVLAQVRRLSSGIVESYDYIDVRANSSGYISLDSKLGTAYDHTTSAKNLGEWLGAPGYTDADGNGHKDAYIKKLYSQGNPLIDIDLEAETLNRSPKLYNASNGLFSGGNAQGAVALDFYEPADQMASKYMVLTTPIFADSVIVVYRNATSTGTQGLVSATSGIAIMSKVVWPDNSEHGLSVYDQTYFSPTQIGREDSGNEFHVVSLYPKNLPQRLVVDSQEMSIDVDTISAGIEGTNLQNQAKYKYVGSYGLGSYPHRGFISAVIFYDENKYAKRQQIHDYLNIMFGIQNIPTLDPINVPVIKSFTEAKGTDTSSANFTVSSALPAGTKSGELLVAVILSTESGNPVASTPTGWTLKTANGVGSGSVTSSILYRIADGTEGSHTNFTLSNAGTAHYSVHQLRIFGGTNYLSADPIQTVGLASSATGLTTIDANEITTAGYDSGRLAIAVAGFEFTGAGAVANPASVVGTGWSVRDTFDQGAGPGLSGLIAEKEKVYIYGKPTNTGDLTINPAVLQTAGLAYQFTVKMGEPEPFDRTWVFNTGIENWSARFGLVSQISTYTPSSDTQKAGILVLTRNSTSFNPQLEFDLSGLIDYDNTQTLYYEITYSLPSSGLNTGLNRFQWGNGGSYDDYSTVNSGTYNTWITVDGALTYSGSDDRLYITFDPVSTATVPQYAYIDSIRVSHYDFR